MLKNNGDDLVTPPPSYNELYHPSPSPPSPPEHKQWSASVPPPGPPPYPGPAASDPVPHPGPPPYPGPAAVILEVNNSLERSQAERRPTWTVIDNDARPQCRPTFAFLQLLILLVIIMIMSFRLAFYYH